MSIHVLDSTAMSRMHRNSDSSMTFNGKICNKTNTLIGFIFTRIGAS